MRAERVFVLVFSVCKRSVQLSYEGNTAAVGGMLALLHVYIYVHGVAGHIGAKQQLGCHVVAYISNKNKLCCCHRACKCLPLLPAAVVLGVVNLAAPKP